MLLPTDVYVSLFVVGFEYPPDERTLSPRSYISLHKMWNAVTYRCLCFSGCCAAFEYPPDERTLSPRSYISLHKMWNAVTDVYISLFVCCVQHSSIPPMSECSHHGATSSSIKCEMLLPTDVYVSLFVVGFEYPPDERTLSPRSYISLHKLWNAVTYRCLCFSVCSVRVSPRWATPSRCVATSVCVTTDVYVSLFVAFEYPPRWATPTRCVATSVCVTTDVYVSLFAAFEYPPDERTLSPRSYISLHKLWNAVTDVYVSLFVAFEHPPDERRPLGVSQPVCVSLQMFVSLFVAFEHPPDERRPLGVSQPVCVSLQMFVSLFVAFEHPPDERRPLGVSQPVCVSHVTRITWHLHQTQVTRQLFVSLLSLETSVVSHVKSSWPPPPPSQRISLLKKKKPVVSYVRSYIRTPPPHHHHPQNITSKKTTHTIANGVSLNIHSFTSKIYAMLNTATCLCFIKSSTIATGMCHYYYR